MTSRTPHLIAAIGFIMTFSGVPVLAQQAASKAPGPVQDPSAFIKKWDRSGGKGLLDLKAVTDAAFAKFETLDTDHKGRLTAQQLSSALSAQDFAAANPDNDTTIGAFEWLDLVSSDFYGAIPDHTGAVTLENLRTPEGQILLRLVE